MPWSQIEDKLRFDNDARVVNARGPLWSPQNPILNVPPDFGIPPEHFKTFTVRVCQTDHHTGSSQQNLAEGTAAGHDPRVFRENGTWVLDLPYIRDQAQFMSKMDGTATAVLVFEAGGDLFTLAWSECVLLLDPQDFQEAAEGQPSA
jgi:hypothetical protein